MKQTRLLSLFLVLVLALSFVACAQPDLGELWTDATYKKDTTFGSGSKTIEVEVIAGESSVTFTIHTDKETVGAALMEHNLIEGDEGAYGLYIKKVNGILADYDVDQSWWGFYKNGEMMMTGVDLTAFADGDHYELKYER